MDYISHSQLLKNNTHLHSVNKSMMSLQSGTSSALHSELQDWATNQSSFSPLKPAKLSAKQRLEKIRHERALALVNPKKQFDESKYPVWLFKKQEDPVLNKLLEDEEIEKNLKAQIGEPHDFDMVLAEHRARSLERDLGLDFQRKGKEVYNSGGPFMIEMNLHSAGMPLKSLIEKVETTLLEPSSEVEEGDMGSQLGSNTGSRKGSMRRKSTIVMRGKRGIGLGEYGLRED